MFHHKNSSKSSDESLQINLLQPKDRESRIKIARNPHNSVPMTEMNNAALDIINPSTNLKRNSAHVTHSEQFKHDIPDAVYDNYTRYDNIDISESLLTNTNDHNGAVGFILFLLLVAMEMIQTVMLCASQRVLEIRDFFIMGIFVSGAEIFAFGILYYYNWVQRLSLITHYIYTHRKPSQTTPSTLISHPLILILLTTLLTLAWQLSYCVSLVQNKFAKSSHLILFYFNILPQIAGSLFFEEEINKDFKLKTILYVTIAYVWVYGFVTHVWLGIGGFIGVGVMVLGIRCGRVVLLVQYVVKGAVFVVLAAGYGYWYLFVRDPLDWWEQQYPYPYTPDIPTVLLFFLLSILSIIIVRYINNKILRTELYKYYYLDHKINSALLILPLIYGYIDNSIIDIGIGIIGAFIFICVCVAVSYKKEVIDFQQDIDMENIGAGMSALKVKRKRKQKRDKISQFDKKDQVIET